MPRRSSDPVPKPTKAQKVVEEQPASDVSMSSDEGDSELDSDLEEFIGSDAPVTGSGSKALLMRAALSSMQQDESDEEEEEEEEEEDETEDASDADDEEAMDVDGDGDEAVSGEEDEDDEESEDTRTWTQRVKQRVLVCSSRGVTHRQRHLMSDLLCLLPHSKKENKLDQKKHLGSLNEIAELTSCNKVLYLESRRGTDLYMWMSHAPNGPSIKFEVLNVHTMDELNMTGNHLKGSRAILSFDSSFDSTPHKQLIKELLTQTFNVPKSHRRSKPFFDHVLMFAWVDNKVWVRNFQITETAPTGTVFKPNSNNNEVALNEVGPRFVLNPIKLFQGSFGGIGLWENPDYMTPAAVRRAEKQELQGKYASKDQQKVKLVEKAKKNVLPEDPLANVFKE